MRWPKGPNGRQVRYATAFTLGLTVAGMGYASSFTNLTEFARRHHFVFPVALPIGLDFGIPALLLLDSLRPSAFLRWSAWAIAATTVGANAAVTPGGGFTSPLLHAVLPAIAILVFEAARHQRDDSARMDRVRFSRYVVSPVRTPRLRVRMVRWEITSYEQALRLESAILMARTVLVSEYGARSWWRTRRHVPVILRHQLHTGGLPLDLFFGTDWQGAVGDWVREALDTLDPHRQPVLPEPEQSQEDPIPVYEPAPRDPWDLVWDHRDQLVPADVPPVVFAQAIALARDNFEQVGRHVTGESLRERLKIAKPRANAIASVLKTAIESGTDQALALQDPQPERDASREASPETEPDRNGPAGPDADIPAFSGGPS